MAESENNHILEDLEETFNRAAKHLQTIISGLSTGQLLNFYGLYKQAVIGPCNTAKPSWYQTQAKQKWEAWKSYGEISREVAMENYIREIARIDPNWKDDIKNSNSSWISVSRLTNTEEELADEDKTFLDWVKEGNESRVLEALKNIPILVDHLDDDGILPIHWAADRGHLAVLRSLIENGADVNSRDSDGQTPLHYAASCGHQELVKYLLSAGAVILKDDDGMEPQDVADQQTKAIFF
ncbi:acyl-CoA-binding domain-containing protein 6-like [Prorops nasuta]|uniref:acyl-CoA-binding domain-containing protein 6-like n=1 Tax=Prorops nasuta TaxID=863751 RepID=UPI0034CF4EA3